MDPKDAETLAVAKASARKQAFARRKAAHSPRASAMGATNLLDFLADRRGQAASGYMAIRTEIDPLPVMRELAKSASVGIPVVLGPARALEFHRWDEQMELKAGAFGALVPVTKELVIPRVVIVPLAAFDAKGHRLGYGGGFYDRTLSALRRNGSVFAVGFAYSAQQTDSLPAEGTDQILDAIVTETDIFHFSS